MANTYTWKVSNLERTLADNKVYSVHYTVNAVSDEVNPNSENGGFYTAGAYGSVGLDGELTIDFADLTEEVVLGWVKEALGGDEKVESIQGALDAQIAEQQAPSKSLGLPW